jgi:hypothetical protein
MWPRIVDPDSSYHGFCGCRLSVYHFRLSHSIRSTAFRANGTQLEDQGFCILGERNAEEGDGFPGVAAVVA